MKIDNNTGVIKDANIINTGAKIQTANSVAGMEALKGQVISGTVQDVLKDIVKIALPNGKIMEALLENGVTFNRGDEVSLLVKSNIGSKLVLQNIELENMSMAPLIEALKNAGAKINERNILMIKEMMSYGMSIDKASVSGMEKLVSAYEEADVATLVSMKQHNIAVSKENIEWFEAYKGAKNKLELQISDLLKSVKELALNTLDEGRENVLSAGRENLNPVPNGEIIYNTDEKGNILLSNSNNGKELQVDNAAVDDVITAGGEPTEGNVVLTRDDSRVMLLQSIIEDIAFDNEASKDFKNSMENINISMDGNRGSDIDKDIGISKSLADMDTAKASSNTEEKINVLNKQDTDEKINADIKTNIGDTIAKISVNDSEIISQADVKLEKLEKNIDILKDRWSVDIRELEQKSPEEVKKIIEDTVWRIERDMTKLAKALSENGFEKSEAYANTKTIQSNISFMNELGGLVTCMQVPIKTKTKDANSELYVYNKKRGKNDKDSPLTAFIHLDMENLGATDIRVTMDKNHIVTSFAMEDSASVSIVNENLELLKNRLESLGYSVNISVENKEEKKSIFEDVLSADKPQNDIKRYSFDISL